MDRQRQPQSNRLRCFGLWTALILLAAVSLTVFAVCACKSLG
jgi:hypothetical protein